MTTVEKAARDVTKVRNQPSLTTASGTSWLVVGGAFLVIALIVVVPLIAFPPKGLALGVIVAMLVIYGVMIFARNVLPAGRVRLATLAAGMITIAALALVTLAIIAGVAWAEAGFPL